jgi:hypothetical protein
MFTLEQNIRWAAVPIAYSIDRRGKLALEVIS